MRIYITASIMFLSMVSFGQVILTSSDLPVVRINTNNQDIPDEPKISATMEIINHAGGRNNVTDVANEFSGNIGIELRGESSQSFPMKSYGIEIRDENGDDKDQSIFGMQAESDWVLYAPYTDKTLMRNVLAYNLSNAMGHWAPHTKYVELVLNGEYMGVYVFLEKIKRKRVNIKKLDGGDSTGDKLTGGYIFAIDKEPDAWTSSFKSPGSEMPINFKYIYPKPEDINEVQKNYIKNYMDSFENVLAGAGFADPATGYRKFVDDQSFIDYLLVNEVSRNVDGYRISTYLNKDRNSVNPKIKAGPVWDYDLAFRNADYCNGSDPAGWAYQFNDVCASDGSQVPFWWRRFLEDPLFQSDLLCRWTVLRQTILRTAAVDRLVDSAALVVQEAQQRHFTKWPMLGSYVWPNPQPIPTSYPEELSTLKAWLYDRLTWIDNNLAKVGPCAAVLAVHDIHLMAEKIADNIRVSWRTETGDNSDHFIAERSLDGRNFVDFAQVPALHSSSGNQYMLVDEHPGSFDEEKIGYRVRSVDRSGNATSSNIVTVTVGKPPLLTLFPNPAAKTLELSYTSTGSQLLQFFILNSTGQNMLAAEKRVVAGVNHFTFDVAAWSKGLYILRVIAKTGVSTSRSFLK